MSEAERVSGFYWVKVNTEPDASWEMGRWSSPIGSWELLERDCSDRYWNEEHIGEVSARIKEP